MSEARRRPTAPAPEWGRSLAALAGARPFQQAAVLVATVVIAGAVILWAMLVRTSEIISRQVIETLIVEADGLAAIAETAGPAAAVNLIARRAKDGDGRLYLVVSATGTKLGGNLDRWPSQMPPASGGATSGGTFEYASGSGGERKLAAGVSRTLAGDLGLVVARDLELQRDLARQTRWLYLAGFGALAIAGLVAGLLASRLTMGRIGEITATSDQIMSGDMSRRVPLSGSGDELDRLAGNLNQMLDRIESLMAGLREVSDNIAHDLKTPLTRLRTRAEAALRGGDGAQAREGLGRVIEDADELIKTFNALLLIARLEAGAVEGSFETFDLTALVQDVAELYEPVAEEAQLSLVCEVAAGVTVEANRHLVGQAIANLIDNAIKYGARAGSIAGGADRPDIVVTLALDGRDIRIAVADRGPGIPAEDRARVLKRFVRLEASRTRPGTGLGLSLVAAVARLHGGRILLEDNAPGLRIVLILPHAAATAGR